MGLTLEGKVAVVTGASSGIGEATARALAGAGMVVVAMARRGDRLEALAEQEQRIRPRVADVTVDEDVWSAAAWVADELGACHVLVNNAGTSSGRRLRGREDVDQILSLMDLNFAGTLRCMAAFADLLFSSAPARVINVASVAGKVGVGNPGYSASKFAVVGLTESVRGDWGRKGVAVSQLNPGFIRTESFPQDGLRKSRIGRLMVSEPSVVADAVVEVARSGTPERTVPRWYRGAAVIRHLAAPLYWSAVRRGAL